MFGSRDGDDPVDSYVRFSRNVQLAATWRIIADIVRYHGTELEMCIEQYDGDTDQYSLAVTERVLGCPFILFDVFSQEAVLEGTQNDFQFVDVNDRRPASELGWDVKNYVAAFLCRDPHSVVLDIEAFAGLSRKEYDACELTPSTLAVTLIAGILHRKMFTRCRLEVSNAFRYGKKCGVRPWAQPFSQFETGYFDFDDVQEDWVPKAKSFTHLWKICPAVNMNARESFDSPGLVFELDACKVFVQGAHSDSFSLWDMHKRGTSYAFCVDFLEENLDSVLKTTTL